MSKIYAIDMVNGMTYIGRNDESKKDDVGYLEDALVIPTKKLIQTNGKKNKNCLNYLEEVRRWVIT